MLAAPGTPGLTSGLTRFLAAATGHSGQWGAASAFPGTIGIHSGETNVIWVATRRFSAL